MDELCIIVKKIMPRMKDYEDDGPWILVALAPNCRFNYYLYSRAKKTICCR